MTESRASKTIRLLGLLVGVFMLGLSLFILIILKSSELWPGLIIGPLFIIYGLGGKAWLSKVMPGMSRNVS